MARVKGGYIHKNRRKKVLKQAKGYFGSKHRLYKTAKEQLMTSYDYARRDRRQKKRDFRKLWIVRINAACRDNDISYSRFIDGLNKAAVKLNRKALAEMAVNDAKGFAALVVVAKEALNGKATKAKENATKEVEVIAAKVEAKTETKVEPKAAKVATKKAATSKPKTKKAPVKKETKKAVAKKPTTKATKTTKK